MNRLVRIVVLGALAGGLVLAARALPGRTPAHSPHGAATRAGVRDSLQRGVCWVAGQRVAAADFDPLVGASVTWISQTPFGWQDRFDDPDFRIVTEGRVYWGETDSGLVATTRLAHARGMRVLLKPHLWLSDRSDGKWEGAIAMKDEVDWARWFARYEEFIVHYARLAESAGMDALCVGTELSATSAREADWRRVIAAVRRVYRGPLVYAANWSGEFERVRFWDALDFIGVQAYFPLSDRSRPSVDELVAGWAGPKARLAGVAGRFHKRVLFTEIGYKAADRATVEPWLWRTDDRENPGEQARAYEAAFRALWGEPWFAGIYWWKWFPADAQPRHRGDRRFSPQGKPAERVIARWYSETPARTRR